MEVAAYSFKVKTNVYLRRWAGTSPKKFLQYISIEHAKNLLKQEHSVFDATYDTGLSSTSRLHDLFIQIGDDTCWIQKWWGKLNHPLPVCWNTLWNGFSGFNSQRDFALCLLWSMRKMPIAHSLKNFLKQDFISKQMPCMNGFGHFLIWTKTMEPN